MQYSIRSNQTYSVTVEKESATSNSFQVLLNGKTYFASIKELHPDGRIKTISVNNKIIPVDVLKQADGSPKTVFLKGVPFDVDVEKITSLPFKAKPAKKTVCGDIKATLPGQILSVMIKVGDTVKKGQPLLILESMKMENEMLSPKEGVVRKILVEVGQVVAKDEVMIQVS